jgi:hypothetical protein
MSKNIYFMLILALHILTKNSFLGLDTGPGHQAPQGLVAPNVALHYISCNKNEYISYFIFL